MGNIIRSGKERRTAVTAAWDAAIRYPVGALAVQGGTVYVAGVENIGQQPPNLTYWTAVGAGEAGEGVPQGGGTGEVLAKASGDDYDTEWVAPSGDISGAWPVGSVFISVVDTNPATLLGFGTWAAFGSGRVLVGRSSEDADFDTAEETGGAKTQTPSAHAGAAVADHAAHTHAVTSNVAVADHAAKNTDAAGVGATQRGSTSSTLTLKAHVHNISAYAHAVTNNQVTSGNPSAALTHDVTQPSNHDAISVVQPYVVVYMWKRTE